MGGFGVGGFEVGGFEVDGFGVGGFGVGVFDMGGFVVGGLGAEEKVRKARGFHHTPPQPTLPHRNQLLPSPT